MGREKFRLDYMLAGLCAIGLIATFSYLNSWSLAYGDFSTWRYDFDLLRACWNGDDNSCSSISRFPMAYSLNSAMLTGVSDIAGGRWRLVVLNFTYLAIPLFILSYRAEPLIAPTSLIYCVAIFLSPLIPAYALSGHIEIQSGVALGLFFTSVNLLRDEHDPKRRMLLQIIAMLTGFMQPLYKDTNGAMLLIVYGFLASARFALPWLGGVKKFYQGQYLPWTIGFAIGAGQLAAIWFNWMRYQSALPIEYLKFAHDSWVDAHHSIIFFLFSIISPNGGVLIFWSFAFAISVYLLKRFQLRIIYQSLDAAIVFVILQLMALSQWWSPFGWASYGDRLMIPAIFALLITMIFSAGPLILHEREKSGRGWSMFIHESPVRNLSLTIIVSVLVGASAYYVLLSYAVDINILLQDTLWNTWRNCATADHIIVDIKPPNNAGLRSPEYYACVWDRLTYFPILSSIN